MKPIKNFRIVITGAGGMLATAVENALRHDFEVIALTEQQLDITRMDAVTQMTKDIKPNIIINAAAYTNVDKCEKEYEIARLVNGIAVGYLAKAAQSINAGIIHISTDYIFDGEKDGPYTEEDRPNPISMYGLSKLIGEQELLKYTSNYIILRTQWLYGENGKNFVDTIIQLAQEKDELQVVDDQYGSPTYTKDLAFMIKWFVEHPDIKGRILNFSNEGIVSWFGFAKQILKLAGIKTNVVPVDSNAFPRPAKRPHNSALDKTAIKRLTSLDIRPWYDALYEYIKTKKVIR
jgi:dTDP-4-dehydrorhamnose reductase